MYRRLFTQPRSLATLRAEFDAAVHQGSEKGTDPQLLTLLQGNARQISQLMMRHWGEFISGQEERPRFSNRKGQQLALELYEAFGDYVDKNVHWLEYFVMDPSWLNLTAVNYAANAAREAANEVRAARSRFEIEYELTRDDLAAASLKPAEHPDDAPPASSPGTQEPPVENAHPSTPGTASAEQGHPAGDSDDGGPETGRKDAA